MAAKFWKIEEHPLTDWGDYASILEHGMTGRRNKNGELRLQRTGPFMPPITLPGVGNIVLTSEARALLESSGLSGFTLLPVEKDHIVELRWEDWNLNAYEPAEFPETGEPEDYILLRPHSPEMALTLGDLFEIIVPQSLRIVRTPADQLLIDTTSWNGADLIRSNEFGAIIFSDRACDWFTDQWGKYIQFDPFSSL